MTRIIVLLLALISCNAFADYYWMVGSSSIHYPSATAACRDHVAISYGSSFQFSRVTPVSETVYACLVLVGSSEMDVGGAYRYGTPCSDDKTYDPVNGSCNGVSADMGTRCGPEDNTGYPKIVNSVGECVQAVRADIASFCKFHGADEFYKNQTLKDVLVQKDPNGNPVQPTDTAQFGCAVKVTGVNCTTPPPNETCSNGLCVQHERSAVCSLNVEHTGQVFNDKADPGVLANARCQSGNCPPPEPKQEKESKPCTYVATGQNSVACVSSEFFGREGQSQCGTVNGVLTCKNDLPKPVSGGIRISTEVTSEPQPDGTTKQTKKDTRTDIKCTGMALAGCVTSSTTSTTVTIKDGNGNVISTTGSCTGKGCPDSNTNPDADGDGFGDCVGGDCGEGEGGASGSGVELPELDEVPEYADSAQGYFDRLSNAPIAKALKNISIPTGGSCNIGSVQVYFGTIDFNSFCTQAPALLNGMYYLFLAIWAWAAIRLFFTA